MPDGAIGAMLIAGANRRAANPEAQLLAAGSAAGIAAIDVTYVMKRRIAPVYLLDAPGEVALLTLGWARHKRRKNSDAGTGKRRRGKMIENFRLVLSYEKNGRPLKTWICEGGASRRWHRECRSGGIQPQDFGALSLLNCAVRETLITGNA